MSNDESNIYVKGTNSGLHVNYNSFEQWSAKTAQVKAFFDRAHNLCSNIRLFQKQIAHIRKVMSWNGYRCYVPNEITKRLKN